MEMQDQSCLKVLQADKREQSMGRARQRVIPTADDCGNVKNSHSESE